MITLELCAPISQIGDMTNPPYRVLLEDRLLPVQAYFNALPDDIFLRALEDLASGVGADYNGVGYVLPSEDDESAPLNGVLFYVPGEEITISNAEMMCHLKEALAAYTSTHPTDRDAAETLYGRIVDRFAD